VVLGLALTRIYLRIHEPAPIRFLRAVHNGSFSDYAAYSIVGLVVALAVLAT
jgi:hypothetical protein